MSHIRSKSDRDRVRHRTSEKQKRKGLMARLAARGIYPEINPQKLPSLKDLERMIKEYDAAGGTVPPLEGGTPNG